MPEPWSWLPSSYWDGNDGSWNSFIVRVGSPPQPFRIFPSTSSQETWVLDPEGCTPSDPSDCPYTRGALPFNGHNSTGLQVNESSTWQTIGLYELNSPDDVLGYGGNGLYGFDMVFLGNQSDSLHLSHEVVAGIADKSFYLGEFGLDCSAINFSTYNNPIPSYMASLVSHDIIPSLSFGYTAGAWYRNKSPGSLTLGGYDADRFWPTKITFPMAADTSRSLQVTLTKISAINTLIGAVNLLPTAAYFVIDSSVSQLWLPSDAVDQFVAAFGLVYDPHTDLFLVNSSTRQKNLQNKATLTFSLNQILQDDPDSTQSIALPYAAFDQQVGFPFYNRSVHYFPIRRAHNSSQYTLGRTLLQEAYLIADWERQNFTVAQTNFQNLNTAHLESIAPAKTASSIATSSPSAHANSSWLSRGDVAGVAIGTLAGAVITILAVWFFCRWRKNRRLAELHPDSEVAVPDRQPSRLMTESSQALPVDNSSSIRFSPISEVHGQYSPTSPLFRSLSETTTASELSPTGSHHPRSRLSSSELASQSTGDWRSRNRFQMSELSSQSPWDSASELESPSDRIRSWREVDSRPLSASASYEARNRRSRGRLDESESPVDPSMSQQIQGLAERPRGLGVIAELDHNEAAAYDLREQKQ